MKKKKRRKKRRDNKDKIKNKVGVGGVAHHRLHGMGRGVGWGVRDYIIVS